MTLLDVVDLDKISTVNSMWENEFLEPWAKVGAALVKNFWENLNLIKLKKTQIIEYDGS